MKNKLFYGSLLLWIGSLTHCNIAPHKAILSKLLEQGYTRDNAGSEFLFTSGPNDTLDEEYHRNFVVKYYKKYSRKELEARFLSSPTIKDSVHFSMSYEQLLTPYCKDTIEVYWNQQLVLSGEYPSNPKCRRYFRELPPSVEWSLRNPKKQKQGSLLVVFHNERIYFDTIVPLRFRNVIVGHPGNGFWLRFEKAVP